ncbi:MAG: diaminopimelate epimerase [Elusimicrobia bacterium]|nr:diaminopimelate epimerase [Elusimicrobiota bacterium]
MKRRFWKMSGAGNDFVLVEGALGRRGPALARRLCDRHSGVGADGLLGMSRRGKEVRLDYWNADGSYAFCGNGTRCGALWARARGWAKGRRFAVRTVRGVLDVAVTGKDRAEVTMPEPRDFRLNFPLSVSGRTYRCSYINTGVPHAVIFVPDVQRVPVDELGRAVRFHKKSGKAGANADFVSVRGGTLILRTYERGVEGETLACGTGIVAAAAVARALGKAGDAVKVRVRSGDILKVSFSAGSTRLEGPGVVTFVGEVSA